MLYLQDELTEIEVKVQSQEQIIEDLSLQAEEASAGRGHRGTEPPSRQLTRSAGDLL